MLTLRIYFLSFVIYGIALGQTGLPFFEPVGSEYHSRTRTAALRIASSGISLTPSGSTSPVFIRFTGSSGAALQGSESSGVTNYLSGSDASSWRIGIPHYSRLIAREVYPAIDAHYYFHQSELEFDFIAKPGADLSLIELEITGHTEMRPSTDGDLDLKTAGGHILLKRPVAYQVLDGIEEKIDCRYALRDSGRIGLIIADYDRAAEIVIDPVLQMMTYLGGSGSDHIQAVAVDSAGNPIVAGYTNSDNFPGISHPAGSLSLFVTKLNAAGTSVIYTTVLGSRPGGSAQFPVETITSIAADSQGDAFVTGLTLSNDFPTTAQAWQAQSYGGFATELGPGGAPVYSTLLGPSGWGLTPIRLRVNNGLAYIAGNMSRPEFLGTQGAFQRNVAGGSDFFVLALKSDGSGPVFATAFGGSGNDNLSDMAIDRDGNIVLVGSSASADVPTTDSAGFTPPAANNYESLLVRMDALGTRLLYSAWLGNSSLGSLEASPDGGILIAGGPAIPDSLAGAAPHYSIVFPPNRANGFILKWSAENHAVWSADVAISPVGRMSIDAAGNIYSGSTPGWMSGGALSNAIGYGVSKLSADGSALLYSSGLFGSSPSPPPPPRMDRFGWRAGPVLPIYPPLRESFSRIATQPAAARSTTQRTPTTDFLRISIFRASNRRISLFRSRTPRLLGAWMNPCQIP